MERERGPAARVADRAPPDPQQLSRLIGEARAADALLKFAAAGKINALLIALRTPGNEVAEARSILAELDVSALDGLVDGEGRSCRKEAVETLLACGFPHALEVDPGDLAFARKAKRDEKLKSDAREADQAKFDEQVDLETAAAALESHHDGTSYALYAGALGQSVAALFTLPRYFGLSGAALLLSFLMVIAAFAFQQTHRRSDRWGPVLLLLIGGAGSLACAFQSAQWQLAISAYMCGLLLVRHVKTLAVGVKE